MKRKRDLDQKLATLLGKKTTEVSVITSAFLKEIMERLVEDRAVHLDGFGRMKLIRERGVRQPVENMVKGTFQKGQSNGPMSFPSCTRYRVSFSKATPFNDVIRERIRSGETTMDKFGVDESVEDQEKMASQGCPSCGGKVEKHGKVLTCERCGTEPFEKEKSG